MKKPIYFALGAVAYIVLIVLGVNATTHFPQKETIIIPMIMLGLFVLSAAIMGFLFLSEPVKLFLENRKQEALAFFLKIVGFFACFVAIFVIVLYLI
ncbi:MAG: hypothetical protein V4504_00780 [Patescibacteria group bacterium]